MSPSLNPDRSEVEFWVTLIQLTRPMLTAEANEALTANCTHITGRYWVMEGDTDYLREAGVPFREIGEGAVGALGGLSEEQLKNVCRRSFGVAL